MEAGSTPPDVETEVTPDPTLISQRSARGALELWLMRNMAPLILIGACLGIHRICDRLESHAPMRPKSAQIAAKEKAAEKSAPVDELNFKAGFNVATLMVIAGLAGLVASLMAMALWVLVPDARTWMILFLKNFTVRALPALRAMDLLAVFMVLLSVGRPVVLLFGDSLAKYDEGTFMALNMLFGTFTMGAALITAIVLARLRAKGVHGSEGIWPFWKLAIDNPNRSIWFDIGLGAMTYPICLWMIGLCTFANQEVVKLLGGKVDQHPLLEELSQPQSRGVMIVFVITATAGAGFFEELLFRGVLYNVLRRYFGSVAGAIFAGLIFSLAHNIKSQILGLFMLALILTWLYDRTGRLVAGMTFHALNNLMALLAVLTR